MSRTWRIGLATSCRPTPARLSSKSRNGWPPHDRRALLRTPHHEAGAALRAAAGCRAGLGLRAPAAAPLLFWRRAQHRRLGLVVGADRPLALHILRALVRLHPRAGRRECGALRYVTPGTQPRPLHRPVPLLVPVLVELRAAQCPGAKLALCLRALLLAARLFPHRLAQLQHGAAGGDGDRRAARWIRQTSAAAATQEAGSAPVERMGGGADRRGRALRRVGLDLPALCLRPDLAVPDLPAGPDQQSGAPQVRRRTLARWRLALLRDAAAGGNLLRLLLGALELTRTARLVLHSAVCGPGAPSVRHAAARLPRLSALRPRVVRHVPVHTADRGAGGAPHAARRPRVLSRWPFTLSDVGGRRLVFLFQYYRAGGVLLCGQWDVTALRPEGTMGGCSMFVPLTIQRPRPDQGPPGAHSVRAFGAQMAGTPG